MLISLPGRKAAAEASAKLAPSLLGGPAQCSRLKANASFGLSFVTSSIVDGTSGGILSSIVPQPSHRVRD